MCALQWSVLQMQTYGKLKQNCLAVKANKNTIEMLLLLNISSFNIVDFHEDTAGNPINEFSLKSTYRSLKISLTVLNS